MGWTWIAVLLLYLLAGCATAPTMTLDQLKAEGYGHVRFNVCDIYFKETQWDGRRYNFCAVPTTGTGGYNWRVTVIIDGNEEWSHDSGTWTPTPTILQHGITCVTTDPLPPGKMTWRAGFRYFH